MRVAVKPLLHAREGGRIRVSRCHDRDMAHATQRRPMAEGSDCAAADQADLDHDARLVGMDDVLELVQLVVLHLRFIFSTGAANVTHCLSQRPQHYSRHQGGYRATWQLP